MLDVPGICRLAHERGLTVICDATVATPFLQPTLRRAEITERPDFVIHSYTKDLSGSGNTTAGVVIARTERMFMPKGATVRCAGHDGVEREYRWDETMFWNVYYVKGAFLDSDKAFEVLSGMRTVELRLLAKCINTIVLAQVLAQHPMINVQCSAVPGHPNAALREQLMTLGLPAPLFTIDFERAAPGAGGVSRDQLKRLFDNLEPAFGLQVSLGQIQTTVLCPALTSHSELGDAALREAGISPAPSVFPLAMRIHAFCSSTFAVPENWPSASWRRVSQPDSRQPAPSMRCMSRSTSTCIRAGCARERTQEANFSRPSGAAAARCGQQHSGVDAFENCRTALIGDDGIKEAVQLLEFVDRDAQFLDFKSAAIAKYVVTELCFAMVGNGAQVQVEGCRQLIYSVAGRNSNLKGIRVALRSVELDHVFADLFGLPKIQQLAADHARPDQQ